MKLVKLQNFKLNNYHSTINDVAQLKFNFRFVFQSYWIVDGSPIPGPGIFFDSGGVTVYRYSSCQQSDSSLAIHCMHIVHLEATIRLLTLFTVQSLLQIVHMTRHVASDQFLE